MSLTATIKEAVKAAMRAKAKERLATLRLITSEFKRVEVDERVEIDDDRALVILDKMCKQRRDSIAQYQSAGREDLAAVEQAEIDVISEYLPAALSEDELSTMVAAAISETGATGMQDMGKVMAIIKPQAQGRADMAQVSKLVKAQLG